MKSIITLAVVCLFMTVRAQSHLDSKLEFVSISEDALKSGDLKSLNLPQGIDLHAIDAAVIPSYQLVFNNRRVVGGQLRVINDHAVIHTSWADLQGKKHNIQDDLSDEVIKSEWAIKDPAAHPMTWGVGEPVWYIKNNHWHAAKIFETHIQHGHVRYYIDAQTTELLLKEHRVCSFTGDAEVETLYFGRRTCKVEEDDGRFILHDVSRGEGIFTFDAARQNNYVHNHTNWESDTKAARDGALDVHWGSQVFFDILRDTFNYKSLDNNDLPVVSIANGDFANAFWTGEQCQYGNGAGNEQFPNPWTHIMIVAHEMAHGITQFSSGLIYSDESGGLNESFSDIMGATAEYWTDSELFDWRLGDEWSANGEDIFRNMADPTEVGMADTYGGSGWNRNNGPHTNSSIGNKWYSLITLGGTGINDFNQSYDVEGIGFSKAQQIAFITWTESLRENSTYPECAELSVKVAEMLYGNCTSEVEQVVKAWNAVGLLENANGGISADQYYVCDFEDEIQFTSPHLSNGGTWDFGDGSTSDALNAVHTYNQTGSYIVKWSGSLCNGKEVDFSLPQHIIVDTTGKACDTLRFAANQFSIETDRCQGVITDPGGIDGDYTPGIQVEVRVENPDANFYHLNIREIRLKPHDAIFLYGINALSGNHEFIRQFLSDVDIIDLELDVPFDGFVIQLFSNDSGDDPRDGFIIDYTCSYQERDVELVDFGIFNFECDRRWFMRADLRNADGVTWDFGDGEKVEGEPFVIKEYTAPGEYTVLMKAYNRTDTLERESRINVELIGLEAMHPEMAIEGEEVTFTAFTSAGSSPYEFVWNINGETFNGQTVRHTFNDNGTYPISLRGVDAFDCPQDVTTTIEISPLVSTEEIDQENQITLNPHPADQQTEMRFLQHFRHLENMHLLAISGQSYSDQLTYTVVDNNRVLLNTSAVPSGIYILSADVDDKRVHKKLLVQ